MIDTKEWEKVKEYDKFVLFKHKKTGIRECILKIDLMPRTKRDLRFGTGAKGNKWDRTGFKLV